ncbi:hypothetical protein HanHA300_Chr15g0585691 [Helianthus annuus]|nr:hypothetical protein HanHA300_Chr15g0585691 [Helianthus annuus]KAJ0474944.1 hypothetical protein HanHA89_Chr15g0635491 [Helianthus annuus]KAJ0650499.1 hypothetical protein HanLR1_Chr15g0596411 [Helianthus annuus]KAJ0654251.1 hypothetical protein HanOQP8_Chr15g0592821 [Helianthus annuus]
MEFRAFLVSDRRNYPEKDPHLAEKSEVAGRSSRESLIVFGIHFSPLVSVR